MLEYVLGFRFNEHKTQVVLIEKLKPEWQKGKYNGIGGKIETNETPIKAMVREFKEETSLDTNEEDWSYQTIMTDNSSWKVHVFMSVGSIKQCKTMETEKVIHASSSILPDKAHWNLHWLIPLCLDPELKKPILVEYTNKECNE
jgi:8-oxo-dGTP diphosphatase